MSPVAPSPVSRPAPFITTPPSAVLFLCIHNSARSQMAEGFARQLAPAGSEIWSAGTEPSRVHPLAIEVMREIGIDIAQALAKSLEEVPLERLDTVVTLCGEAEEACPVLRGEVRRAHWPLPDPAKATGEKAIETFREVRDEIRWRVSALWGGRSEPAGAATTSPADTRPPR